MHSLTLGTLSNRSWRASRAQRAADCPLLVEGISFHMLLMSNELQTAFTCFPGLTKLIGCSFHMLLRFDEVGCMQFLQFTCFAGLARFTGCIFDVSLMSGEVDWMQRFICFVMFCRSDERDWV